MSSNPPHDEARQALRRILLVRNDRLGDLVLTLPAIEAVRRHWPQAHLTALVSPYAGPLASGHPAIDELLFDAESDNAWQLGRRLRALRFDAALVFNSRSRNCLAVWAARIPRRVCWAYKPLGWLTATDRVHLRRSHPPVHESQFAMAFVRQLGERLGVTIEPAAAPGRLKIDPLVSGRVTGRIARTLGTAGPLFGVHPGNKRSAYNWPPAQWAELVARLATFGRVMVTGGPQEQPLLDDILASLPQPMAQRVGCFTDWGLHELAAALAQLRVLVVSSTGPMHIAGAVGTPTVALFSPHPAHVPAKWAPLGDNHTILVAPLAAGEDARVPAERGTELMARISIETVLQAALRYVPNSEAA